MSTNIEERNPGLKDLGRYEYGWSDSDSAGATAKRGLNEDVVRDISAPQERAAVDARPAAEVAAAVRQEADAQLGLRPHRHRLPEHQVLREVHREAGHHAGTSCPRTSRTPTTGWASRRPRSSASSPVSRPSTSPRSSTTRSVRTWRRRASSSSTPTRACASTRTCSASTSRRSSRPVTTSSPRSTRPSGRVARSSTSRRASTSTSRCRPTSGSTPRTWASSSAP